MSVYQFEILDDSSVCSNCLRRQRRPASRPLSRGTHADVDEEGYPVQDGDGHFVSGYSERLQWRTIVEDVPGPVVSDAAEVFCECGADGPYTRIWSGVWHDCDVDRERLAELVKAVYHTLVAKGYRVDARRLGRAARDAYERLPRADAYTDRYGPGIRDIADDQPTCINDVLEAAVERGVLEDPEPAAKVTA